ncbi:MAG: hypothetical protein PHS49_06265 [Candidatus Gracilibacteria bacterium]|nr:hypothetical protein [Candidatus Gracilibacteria bacterium]
MYTPWWQSLLYYLLIWPIKTLLGFLYKNIVAGTSSFIQKITVSILTILIGAGIINYITSLAKY